MTDTNKMDRTWLCSVLFMDIADYSSQSVGLQMKWKQRFNGYLTDAIKDVPENDRVILDTGDGAAVCFLGAPEVAMFAALELCRSFGVDERDHAPGLRVRLGINLGPVKLVKDINGALNAIGDGINAGQRIMSFAQANQILVSQSFYEVVSRLDDDYKLLFQLKGIETDKHVREHTVYHLTPPGSENRQATVANADGQTITAKPQAAPAPATKSRLIPWLIAGVAVAALATVGVMHFSGGSTSAPAPAPAPAVAANTPPAAPVPSSASDSPPAGEAANPVPAASKPEVHADQTPTPTTAKTETPPAKEPPATPVPEPKGELNAGRKGKAPAPESGFVPSAQAKAAYDEGMSLMDSGKHSEAVKHFDDAIRAQPDYVDAYVARAETRRRLEQFELSLPDCEKIIQLVPGDARGYNCRGFARQALKQLEAALPDYDKAISLNPNFVIAYEHRGTTYNLLQQYDKAVQDYSQAMRLMPHNALFMLRRGEAYTNLKQYDKAIRDFTDAIRITPNDKNAYRLRAIAEQASGDTAGAEADREKMKDATAKKRKKG